MAGTIFGLPLSQRVDLNGLPSIGWLLYLYQANTSTPVNSYQDTALTVLNPWPLQADSTGMIPQFWLADGNYRARATNANGSITYFDQPSILALGASSGAAPSGGVDAAAIFQTGDTIWLDKSGPRTGWVIDNGTTIGSALSGASQRNNLDCLALFQYLWNTFDQTICPVVGGRGGSAAIDWGADKKITMPDKRGRTAMGADAMGSASSGRFTSVPVVTGAIDTPGSIVGGNTHTLTEAQLAAHGHGGTTGGQTAAFTFQNTTPGFTTGANSNIINNIATTGQPNTLNTQSHAHPFTTDPAGSGSAHNNTQLAVIGTFYRKL